MIFLLKNKNLIKQIYQKIKRIKFFSTLFEEQMKGVEISDIYKVFKK